MEERVEYGVHNLLQSRDMYNVWYNEVGYNSNKSAAAMLVTSRGYDTRKVLLMQPHFTPTTYPNQTTEQWLPVPGYEGIYEVSDQGQIRSLDRNDSSGRPRRGRVLRPALNEGYLYVQLCKDATPRVIRVHVLVAAAFIGARPAGYVVNHKDAVKTNNHQSNLEYVTAGGNTRHSAGMGHMGKLTKQQVWEIRKAHEADRHLPYIVTAEKYGVNASTISDIVRAKRRVSILNPDGSLYEATRRGLTGVDVVALHESGLSLNAIARLHDVNVSTVSKAYHKALSAQVD